MQMLYACENVRTVEYGAKLNTPPMKAFRAPGFVEGTFGLECLLDELAAKLDLDPLELRRRNHADADAVDGRPFSSKNLLECYRRAEPHWARRDEVRARSEGPWRRGVGLASQIWYGGGGPPSYAWVRIGADGRATVVTAMQDIGTGTRDGDGADRGRGARPPARPRRGRARRLGARPVRDASRPDRRRCRRWARRCGPPPRTPRARCSRSRRSGSTARSASSRCAAGDIVSADGGSWPLEEITGLLEDGQILGKGARGPNPAGMRVLTFGVQVAEVAVDVETGEVRSSGSRRSTTSAA